MKKLIHWCSSFKITVLKKILNSSSRIRIKKLPNYTLNEVAVVQFTVSGEKNKRLKTPANQIKILRSQ